MSDSREPRPVDDLGQLIEVLARQVEISSKVLPLLERIAIALERAPSVGSNFVDGRGRGLVEFRVALDHARWDEAEEIARRLNLESPDDPQILALSAELDRSRQFAIDDLLQKIEASRQANDPEGVIGSRDELARILRGEALLELDRPLVKWLMSLIQRRLRTGTIRADMVVLAARIAESFGGTTEGASLRASLPTLRRSAGLCPRCAEPYTGVGDACPKCLAASTVPAPAAQVEDAASVGPELEPEPEEEEIGEPIDLNNERFWQDPSSSPSPQLDGGPDVGKDGG